MIRQVRMYDRYMNATGELVSRLQPIFAFGTHPNVTSEEEAHPVTFGRAIENKLRIIMDELLVGNNLEEIACRAIVDSDAYDVVPLGTTPDDVARCAAAKDVLPSSCSGSDPHSVCICKNDAGCGEIQKGAPVGVLDVNQDGAADDTRFIPDAVTLNCGGITLPTDVNNTYWYPSGDQNVPAVGGFEALGPAVVFQVLKPPTAPDGVQAFFPTNTECKLVFASSVVDKQNVQVCAPPDGDVTQDCSPGNTDNFKFKVEPLLLKLPFPSGTTGVSRTASLTFKASAPIDYAGNMTAVTVTPADFTITQPTFIDLKFTPPAAGLAANTMYTITITTALKDYWGQPLTQPITLTFTTGM